MKNFILWIIIVIIGFVLYNNSYPIKEEFNENNKVIIKVFNFNTSWCGWSKKFQSEWDIFTKFIIDNNLTHIHAYDVKCDNKIKGILRNMQRRGINLELIWKYTWQSLEDRRHHEKVADFIDEVKREGQGVKIRRGTKRKRGTGRKRKTQGRKRSRRR